MKKIFTLAAAVLASVAMMATTYKPNVEVKAMSDADSATYFKAYNEGAVTLLTNAKYEVLDKETNHYVKLDQTNNSAYVGVTATQEITKVAFLVTGNGNNKTINAGLIGYTAVAEKPDFAAPNYASYVDPAVDIKTPYYTDAQWVEFDLTGKGLKAVYFAKQWKNVKIDGKGDKAAYPASNAQSLFCYGVRVWSGEAIPDTDSVASVSISAPTTIDADQTATLKATADGATDFWWTAKGSDVKLSETNTYVFTPEAAGEYTFVAYAKNEYNVNPVSAECTIVVNEVEVLDEKDLLIGVLCKNLKDVKGAAADSVDTNLKAAKSIKLDKTKYFGLVLAEGKTLKAGDKVIINIAAGADLGKYMLYADKAGETLIFDEGITYTKSSAESPVICPTGKKEITLPEAAEGKTALYLYRENGNTQWNVTFSSFAIYREGSTPTALDNTEATVKAVKFFRNGQMFIEKNGVIYNAQGVVVR